MKMLPQTQQDITPRTKELSCEATLHSAQSCWYLHSNARHQKAKLQALADEQLKVSELSRGILFTVQMLHRVFSTDPFPIQMPTDKELNLHTNIQCLCSMLPLEPYQHLVHNKTLDLCTYLLH